MLLTTNIVKIVQLKKKFILYEFFYFFLFCLFFFTYLVNLIYSSQNWVLFTFLYLIT